MTDDARVLLNQFIAALDDDDRLALRRLILFSGALNCPESKLADMGWEFMSRLDLFERIR